MKTVMTLALLATLSSAPAMALHATNCSNSDGSIRLEEQEIWGANPVSWHIDGEKIWASAITVKETDKHILKKTQSRVTGGRPDFSEEIYSVFVTLKRKDGGFFMVGGDVAVSTASDFLICRSWRNSAID